MSSNDDGGNRLPQALSPTSIDRWRQCPRRFLYQDVERRQFEDIKTYEQTLGEVIHKVLESLFRLTPEKRNGEAVERYVDWTLLRYAAALHRDNADRLRDEARIQLTSFLDTSAARGSALKVEQTYQLRLKGGLVIQTRVDRVERAESGLLHVIDYKTGRVQVDERDLGRETAAIVQLLAVGKASDVPVEKVIWLYTRSGESITWWPEPDDVDAAVDRLIGLLRAMRSDREFEPNPGGHCVYCPFSSICPAWRGDAGAVAEAA